MVQDDSEYIRLLDKIKSSYSRKRQRTWAEWLKSWFTRV